MQLQSGYHRYHSLRHGSRARYQCLRGYELIGERDAICMNGVWEWTGDPPVCKTRKDIKKVSYYVKLKSSGGDT